MLACSGGGDLVTDAVDTGSVSTAPATTAGDAAGSTRPQPSLGPAGKRVVGNIKSSTDGGLTWSEYGSCDNVAWLKRFAISLLKQVDNKASVAMRRRMAGWNTDFLAQVLGIEGT